MHEFDDAVLECLLENQLQLFPKPVVENLEEAESFLEDCMAVVVDSVEEVIEFFEEEGIDLDCASIDLHDAWRYLGEITGETLDEQIIDRIFEKFCLGK